jgi:hypothetical protein
MVRETIRHDRASWNGSRANKHTRPFFIICVESRRQASHQGHLDKEDNRVQNWLRRSRLEQEASVGSRLSEACIGCEKAECEECTGRWRGNGQSTSTTYDAAKEIFFIDGADNPSSGELPGHDGGEVNAEMDGDGGDEG